MKRIKARKPTALYKTPYWQSDNIQDVEKGKVYFIAKTMGTANGLTQVELGYSAGVRWIALDDWQTLSDKPDKAPERATQVAEHSSLCPIEEGVEAALRTDNGVGESSSEDSLPFTPFPYYFSQRNNYRDANRSCFSSCAAMILKQARPDLLKGGDDEYLERVFSIGDSVEAATQIKALESFGVKAVFETDCSIRNLQMWTCGKDGKAAATGLLHRGDYRNPDPNKSHYVVVSGCDFGSERFQVQDPWLDGYDWKAGVHNGHKDGKDQFWPFEAFRYRFTVESTTQNNHHCGWWLRILD